MPALLAILLLGVAACESGGDPSDGETDAAGPISADSAQPTRSDEAAPVLVDSTLPRAVAGEEGWNYSQAAQADLDSDGEAERVVLTARVELVRGRPAWDDGQPWQVYVEEADSTRTYLYARFVQLGTVEMRVGLEEDGTPPSVVLMEHLPDRIAVYEAVYRGPGDVAVTERFQRRLDPTGDVASPALP